MICLKTLYILLLFGANGLAQDFSMFYSEPSGNLFACDPVNRTREIIYLNSTSGEILSPCYPGPAYSDIENGFKFWRLQVISPNNLPVRSYRLTVNNFTGEERTFYLDFATIVTMTAANTNIFTILPSNRIITLSPLDQGGNSNYAIDENNDLVPDASRPIGSSFEIENITTWYLNVRTDRSESNRVFNITFDTDFNLCEPANPTPVCSASSRGNCVRNSFNNYTCQCNTGFTGSDCSTDFNECLDPANNNCHPNATCMNTNGSFVCECNVGYTGNGITCTDVNECAMGTDDCHPNATCNNTVGSFICTCNEGYTGNGTSCTNVDECALNTDNCHPNATCTDTDGSFMCTCNVGYTGNGTSCSDVDECALNPDTCTFNATCNNTVGSFICTCNAGYTGNGATCVDINECTLNIDNCNSNATCMNTNGSFICICNDGYTGDGLTCTDNDECALNTDNCNDNANCTNTVGSFMCRCNDGYTGNGITCTDIDECALNADNCGGNANCMNTVGSFNCTCNPGYTGDGFLCVDINECALNISNCDGNATCRNTNGSFICNCNTGYTGNGITCMDINECTLNTDNCNDNANCTNTVGSFMCRCNDGYTGNGIICTDINECTDNTDTCDTNANCTNTNGSFICTCNVGYTGSGMTCTDINECEEAPRRCDMNANCTNTNGSFQCTCRSGYTGDGSSCQDIDECALPGFNGCRANVERCNNTEGSFECICNAPEYRGTSPSCMGFFCCGFNGNVSDCTMDGYLEWPKYYNGVTNYDPNLRVSWFVNLTAEALYRPAIRFSFIGLDVEAEQDYVTFSDSPDIFQLSVFAVITGNLSNVLNNLSPASDANPAGFSVADRTYTVNRTELYVHFFSDRTNTTRTGFLILYEIDPDNCNVTENLCQNNGTCVDGIFTYTCENCNEGYTGQNCSQDINECVESPSPCDVNATCNNTIGSFVCTCNVGFTGNGTYCTPLITTDNLMIDTSFNATDSFLTVNFSTNDNGRNLNFLRNYNVTITNFARGTSRTFVTSNVDAANFLPFTFSVMAGQTYEVCVVVGTLGPLAAVLPPRLCRNITSDSIAPLAPVDLRLLEANDLVVNINWTRPNENSTGPTTRFTIEYVRNDCDRLAVVGLNQIDCSLRNITIPASSQVYTILGLQKYRNYSICVRAYTNQIGPCSNTITAYTGDVCPSGTDRVQVSNTPCTYTRGGLISTNFPDDYPDFNFAYWQIANTGPTDFRVTADYFLTQRDQDFVNLYVGALPNVDPGVDAASNPNVIQVEGSRPRFSIVANLSSTDGRFYGSFFSDRYIREDGFLLYYETTESFCAPLNPCFGRAACTAASFDFSCNCPADYGGKICNMPRVRFINPNCLAISSSAVTISWGVTAAWMDDASVIGGISLAGVAPALVTLPLDSRSFDATGFMPFETFSVTLSFVRSAIDADFESMTINCQTAEAAPGQPISVIAMASSATSIRVSWDPPASPNGNILSYEISYAQTDAAFYNEVEHIGGPTSYPSDPRSQTIAGLRPYRNYTVSVSAVNGAGRGPLASDRARTDEGVPQGPVQRVVATTTSESITIEITPPINITGVITYDIESPSLPNLMGQSSPVLLSGLTPNTLYTIMVYPRTGAGRGNIATRVTPRTDESTPGMVGSFMLVGIAFDSFTVSWTPPAMPNGNITSYNLTWTEVGASDSTTRNLTGDVSSFSITSLSPSTDYRLTIAASTSVGTGPQTVILNRTASGLPGAPSIDRVVAVGQMSILVVWSPPATVNGEITGYVLTYMQSDSELYSESVNNGSLMSPGAARNRTIMNLRTFRRYTVTVAAMNAAGTGPNVTANVQTNPGGPEGGVQNVTRSVGFTSANFTITPPSAVTGAFSFDIMYYAIPDGNVTLVTVNDTFFTLSQLMVGTEYNVTVYPVSAGIRGNVPVSFIIMTNGTVPGVVTNLAIGAVTANSVELTWNQPADTTDTLRYRVTWNPPTGSGMMVVQAETAIVPGLNSFTAYTFSVSAGNGFGFGEAITQMQTTSEAAPSQVQNLALNVVDDTIVASFMAPADPNGVLLYYTVRTTQSQAECTTYNDATCLDSVSYIDANNGQLSYTTPPLPSFRTFTISVYVNTSAGNSNPVSDSTRTPVGVPAATVGDLRVEVEPNNNTVANLSWNAPSPFPGPLTYQITVQSYLAGAAQDVVFNYTSSMLTSSILVAQLEELFAYTFAIVPITTAGSGPASPQIVLPRVPRQNASAVIEVPTNQDLQGAPSTTAFNVENPCNRRYQLFAEQSGPIMTIQIIIRQVTASDPPIGFWATSINESPVTPYIAGVVTCSNTNRKKRSLTQNEQAYTVGLNTTCDIRNVNQICNGPVLPNREYQASFRAMNAAGTSNLTNYGGNTRTTAVPTATGLTPGEIAAIVICSVIFVLIIILIIVFCLRRRRRRKNYTVKTEDPYARVSKKITSPKTEAEPSTTYSEREETKTKM